MDWSKAKNILIAALLITNLLLGMAIYNTRSSTSAEQEELKQNTILLMKNHNIHVSEETIPDRSERLPVMRVRYRWIDQETVDAAIASGEASVPPDEEQELSDLTEAYRTAAETFLRLVGITSEAFRFHSMEIEDNVVTVSFCTIYEDFSLDNSRNQIVFRDGMPEEISRSWAEPVAMGQNRKRIMNASSALIKFMTLKEEETRLSGLSQEERGRIDVQEIRLVYWLEGYTEQGGFSEDTAVPYWCIEYNGTESVHIAAYEE